MTRHMPTLSSGTRRLRRKPTLRTPCVARRDELEQIAGPPFSATIAKVPAGVVTIMYPFSWPLAILAASLPYG
jgi:acyl-CoA reductase-like NAD-dependent aldehyde dehydrogenase